MTSQQVGASLGTALLSTIATTAAASYLEAHQVPTIESTVHGLNTASSWATGIVVAALLVTIVLPRRGTTTAS